ncbi:TetR/AcrR family transcriptional regulator [Rhodoluna limnophila]|uniref:TetR/AcrR family transcriptional regulator n=1 Tax=Rhodoluna limnophila TaxID=232537 RepID=UPI0011065EFF|nr:TetR/AcrR family transcriptional regulator [Rhodoluna limnophila]
MTDFEPDSGSTHAGRPLKSSQNEIILKAWQLFEEVGFENTTMSQIAVHVGISRRSLFNYFANKNALLFPAIDEFMDAFRAHLLERPAHEKLFDSLQATLELTATHTDDVLKIFSPGPEVSRARLTDDVVAFYRDVWSREMQEAALDRLGNDQNARIQAGLVGAIAAQVWTEIIRLQRESDTPMSETEAVAVIMVQLRTLFN